jgi:hypothetical protein
MFEKGCYYWLFKELFLLIILDLFLFLKQVQLLQGTHTRAMKFLCFLVEPEGSAKLKYKLKNRHETEYVANCQLAWEPILER